jgi:hypothetical protein
VRAFGVTRLAGTTGFFPCSVKVKKRKEARQALYRCAAWAVARDTSLYRGDTGGPIKRRLALG